MAHETHTDNPYAPLDTGHPSAFTYFKVAMLLVALTAAEVGVF